MPKIYVKCCESTKTKKPFVALVCDLGYRTVYLSFDRATISEISGLPIPYLLDMEVGFEVCLGSVEQVGG